MVTRRTPSRYAPREPKVDTGIVAFLVARAKERILADRKAGILPPVKRFSTLHNYVDANTYFLTSAGNFDAALEKFAERNDPDGDDFMNILNDHYSAAMEFIDPWLKSSALAKVKVASKPRTKRPRR